MKNSFDNGCLHAFNRAIERRLYLWSFCCFIVGLCILYALILCKTRSFASLLLFSWKREICLITTSILVNIIAFAINSELLGFSFINRFSSIYLRILSVLSIGILVGYLLKLCLVLSSIGYRSHGYISFDFYQSLWIYFLLSTRFLLFGNRIIRDVTLYEESPSISSRILRSFHSSLYLSFHDGLFLMAIAIISNLKNVTHKENIIINIMNGIELCFQEFMILFTMDYIIRINLDLFYSFLCYPLNFSKLQCLFNNNNNNNNNNNIHKFYHYENQYIDYLIEFLIGKNLFYIKLFSWEEDIKDHSSSSSLSSLLPISVDHNISPWNEVLFIQYEFINHIFLSIPSSFHNILPSINYPTYNSSFPIHSKLQATSTKNNNIKSTPSTTTATNTPDRLKHPNKDRYDCKEIWTMDILSFNLAIQDLNRVVMNNSIGRQLLFRNHFSRLAVALCCRLDSVTVQVCIQYLI